MVVGACIIGCAFSACAKKGGNNGTAAADGTGKAADFTLQDFGGTEYTLRQFKGKVVLIDFCASWCPPCRASIPKLIALSEYYKAQADKVAIIGINLDENASQAESFIQEQKISYLILKGGDSNVSRAYGVSGIPAFYLIDAQGVIVKQYTGYRPSLDNELKTQIDALIK
jgi:peroxiredoxin